MVCNVGQRGSVQGDVCFVVDVVWLWYVMSGLLCLGRIVWVLLCGAVAV